MRRSFELLTLVATAGILLATSQARQPCATETVRVHAVTSCGPDGNVTITSSQSCTVNAAGAEKAGLPTVGSLGGYTADAGLAEGFQLAGVSADGGNMVFCSARPGDGGFEITCNPSCGEDGGCDPGCFGMLTPQ